MAKPKLKLAEPTLQDQLDAAIAACTAAREELQRAEVAFKGKYPGDLNLYMAGIRRYEDNIDLPHWQQRFERYRQQDADFNDDWNALCGLRQSVDAADRLAKHLQTTITERVDESTARAELATTLEAIAAASKDVESIAEVIDTFEKLVERAKTSVFSATAKLDGASAAIDAAMSEGLSDFLREDSPDRSAGTPDALRATRDRKIEAADELEMAQRALGIAENRLATEQDRSRSAVITLSELRRNAEEIARKIAATAIPRLIEDARAMQIELEGKRLVLRYLDDFASKELSSQVGDFIHGKAFPYEWSNHITFDGPPHPEFHPAAAPWISAIAALSSDAGAPLPE